MHPLPKSLVASFAKVSAAGFAFVAPFIVHPSAMAQDGGLLSSSMLQTGPLTAGPVTFTAPLMLAGLASLPALWWLMRSIPPKPQIIDFPAIRFLFNLQSEDQQPVRMPLWQRLLRLSMVTAVITGLAQPVLNPGQPIEGDGALLMVVDNGWASAHNWTARQHEIKILIDRAERDNRPVIILPTAMPEDGRETALHGPMSADEARAFTQAMKPAAWPADHKATTEALEELSADHPVSSVWLGNGLEKPGTDTLADALLRRGPLKMITDTAGHTPSLLSPAETDDDALTVVLRRLNGAGDKTYSLTATDIAGRAVHQEDVTLAAGETEISVIFDIPRELRQQLARISVIGENSAGSTLLLDEQWQNRPVGIININSGDNTQSLLEDSTYVRQALAPYADLHEGSVDDLMGNDLAVMIMTDSANLSAAARRRIETWIENGGTLLRFAGPRLALQPDDSLLPVELREGERSLDGTLGSSVSARLAPFEEDSPFHGINLPDDIVIKRGVLAEPSLELDGKTWARLEDGTPFVTAEERGKGEIILFHTSADTTWSNIPLSGLFIHMMREAIAQSAGIETNAATVSKALPPLQILDGHGHLNSPAPSVRPLGREAMAAGQVDAVNPPGLYGYETVKYAHNISDMVQNLRPVTPVEGVETGVYSADKPQGQLKGLLLGAGFGLLIVDLLVLLGQQGHLPNLRRRQERGPALKAGRG